MATLDEMPAFLVTWVIKTSAQAAVLIVLIFAVQWLFGRQLAPRAKYLLWGLVIIRLSLPSSFPTAVSLFSLIHWQPPIAASPQSGSEPGAIQMKWVATHSTSGDSTAIPMASNAETLGKPAAPPPPASMPLRIRPRLEWLGAVWLAGMLGMLVHVIASSIRFFRRIRQGEIVDDPLVLETLDRCRAEMGVARNVGLLITPVAVTPALCGVFKPRLLLPVGWLERFTRSELRFIFLHELAHLKRQDILANWVVTFLQALHWFNPFIWLAFARMRSDRELACDSLVLSRTESNDSRAYGHTIIKLVQDVTVSAPLPIVVGILEDLRDVERRIRMIASARPHSHRLIVAMLWLVLSAACLTDGNGQPRVEPTPGSNSSTITGRVTLDGNPPPEKTFEILGSGGEMVVDKDRGMVFYHGGVTVKCKLGPTNLPTITIKADTLTITRPPFTAVAEGNVSIDCKDLHAGGDRATFDGVSDEVTLTAGYPNSTNRAVVQTSAGTLWGSAITWNFNSGTLRASNHVETVAPR